MRWKTIAIVMATVLCTNAVVPAICAQDMNVEKKQDMEMAPPEKPEGEMASGERPNGQPPEMPKGEMREGQPPEMPQGGRPDGQPPAKPGENGGMGGPGGMASGVDSYDSVNDYTEDAEIESEDISSVGTDENAVLVSNGAQVQIKRSDISRVSEESKGGDTSSFYGVGAALLVTDGVLNIDDSTINTNAGGGAGVFAYGDGVAYISDTTIKTEKGTSGGIHVAGGGTLYANNLNVTTQGESSAAIRSDRGGGTMVVDGGSYTSNGTGSPAVYCTADIQVSNADLTAKGSEAVCIEGFNSLRLDNVNLVGNMHDDERNDCTWNVILYQSMSGDSEIGNSTFEMTDGTMTSVDGGLFYTTNTESTFVLQNVEIIYPEENDFFLKCTGNANQRGWGQTGANGADSTFTAINQDMQGDVIWDSISSLQLNVTEGSSFIGAVLDDETNAGNGGNGTCSLNLDESSTWTVTADSVLTNLNAQGIIQDAEGNTVTIQGNDGTMYVKGNSEYVITVDTYIRT